MALALALRLAGDLQADITITAAIATARKCFVQAEEARCCTAVTKFELAPATSGNHQDVGSGVP